MDFEFAECAFGSRYDCLAKKWLHDCFCCSYLQATDRIRTCDGELAFNFAVNEIHISFFKFADLNRLSTAAKARSGV